MKANKLTRHAKNRMRMHNISESEIEAAISKPDFIEPSIDGRLNAWKQTGRMFLRVTYKEEQNRMLIITAVKKQKDWR